MQIKRHKLLNPIFQQALLRLMDVRLPYAASFALADLARVCATEADAFNLERQAVLKLEQSVCPNPVAIKEAQTELQRYVEMEVSVPILQPIRVMLPVQETLKGQADFSAKELLSFDGLIELGQLE